MAAPSTGNSTKHISSLVRFVTNGAKPGGEGGYLGYPISDETGTLDGLGRFNRFEHGVIYWTGAYGAHPVSGGLVNKWAQSGFERGPYGYPTADQQQAGPSWRQDFQFGRMGYPTETAAGVVPEAGDEEPVVPSGRPTTWDEFGVDASLGSAGSAAAGGVGASFNSCVSGQSCLVSNPGSTMPPGTEDPTLDGPVTPASFIPPECTTAVWDATWRMARKNACLVFNSSLEVVNTQGAVVGSIPFNVKTGILSTHRSGEMNQEFRITFGTFVGNVGSPTFKYQPTYTGFGSGQYSVDGPASDSAISAGQVKVLVVKWKEHNMADQDVVARSMLIDFSIGNNSAAITESTSARIRADMFRCDTTMKNSQQNFQQGCVVAAATPQFRLGSDTSEQTGHVQAAVGSGLPGVGTPLHRQADPVTRDINRQTACPAQGAVRDGRRLDGRSCDEYPFASTTEGAATSGGGGRTFNPQCHVPDLGPASGSTGYSVCMIDAAQNSHAGSLLGAFYGTNRVINQDPFKVQAQGGSLPPTP
ncbi:NucA/NucB deoxyribonuclease domain-containing protein [Nocardia salmonicida]|uniref:NucA/NucB deoxyribonuclease domain-containing protein n=1 Tax=Nocardia salmonicida TaxID=53431 RepID=UPI0033F119FC